MVLVIAMATDAAADFDPLTGRVESDEAAFGYGFEGDAPGRPAAVWAADGMPIDGADIEARYTDRDTLEGAGAFLLGGEVSALHLDASAWPSSLMGRRVEVRLWTRAEGTDVEARIYWAGGDLFAAFGGFMMPGHIAGEALLIPSGRKTDDGWRELTTGPIDFAFGGRLAPDALSIFDQQSTATGGGEGFTTRLDADARVRLDGLEIIDLGPAAVPDAPCSLPSQAGDCGPDGACVYGRCVDGAAVFGPRLTQSMRSAFVARRAFELLTFDGSRSVDAQRVELAERFAALDAVEAPHLFWPGLASIYSDCGDGHAGGPIPTVVSTASNVCAAAGVADLLPDAPARPLIYHVGRQPVVDLQIGDAIVAIDDMVPAEWLPLTRPFMSVQGDPEAFAVDAGRTLVDLATLAGAELEVHRCADEGGCEAGGVEIVEVDLAEAWTELWADGGEARVRTGLCDYRLERLSLNSNRSVASRDIGDVRVLGINGVPDSSRWRTRVGEALDDAPELLILDQRVGFGGQVSAVEFILARLFAAGVEAAYTSLPSIGTWDPDAAREHFEACLVVNDDPSLLDCGVAELERIVGAGEIVPPRRVAVLGGAVVSGNEYLVRMLQAREDVRVFAPAPTIGGFGWVLDLPSYIGGLSGGRMQLVDTYFSHGNPDFGTGTGVPPDVVTVYRQSDLLAGRDTFVEAAIEWLHGAEE